MKTPADVAPQARQRRSAAQPDGQARNGPLAAGAMSPREGAQRRSIEAVFGSTAQRVEGEEDELQMKIAAVAQRVGPKDEELLQGRFGTVQRQGPEEDELQMKRAPAPVAQREPAASPRSNDAGLPDGLMLGVESLSGMSLDHVKVHYNSSQPAQLNALAYAQGSDIHLAPGQESHLPNEAWHVVQQAQSRVAPMMQMMGGVAVNHDQGLEADSHTMGAQTVRIRPPVHAAAGGNAQSTGDEQRADESTEPDYGQDVKSGASDEEARLNFLSTCTPLAPALSTAAPVVQGRLFIGARRNPDTVTPELLETLQNFALNRSDNLVASLANHFIDGRDWLVAVRGSLLGRHGFSVTGFAEIVRRPALAGMGNLELEPDNTALGWSFRGRPGWTAEVVAAVETQPGLENIRHVLPYHLIRTQFALHLYGLFAQHNNQPSDVLPDLQALADAVCADHFKHEDDGAAIKGLAMNILARLNSVPGNLWAGSAVENQRLNSLRIRLEGLINQLESGELDQNGVLVALQESLAGAGSPIYRELIAGVIQHLPRPEDPNFTNPQVWIDRLQLAALSAEVDVFPSREELARVENPQQMLNNIPELMDIFRKFMEGNFLAAATRLANIPSPHRDVMM